jgi:hypothetical protein
MANCLCWKLLLLCVLFWGRKKLDGVHRKKILWHLVPQEFDGSHMDCLPREERIVFFLAHVTYKILGDVLLFLIWQSRDKIFSPKGSLVLTSPSTLHANIPFLHDCYICMLVLEKKRYVMFQRELIVCKCVLNYCPICNKLIMHERV